MASNYNRRSSSSGSRSKQGAREERTSQTKRKTMREGSGEAARRREDHPVQSRTSARSSAREKSHGKEHGGTRDSEQGARSRSSKQASSSRSSSSASPRSTSSRSQNIQRMAGETSRRSSHPSAMDSDITIRSSSSKRSDSAGVSSMSGSTKPSSTSSNRRRTPSATRRSYDEDTNRYGPQRTVREYRDQRSSKPRSRLLFISGVMGIILFVLVGAFSALYFSSVFTITTVHVTGNSRVSTEQVLAAADISDDATLLRIDANAIASRISQSPWIDSVQIEREFPSTLVLSINETDVTAVAKIDLASATQGSTYWLVSSNKTWIEQIDAAAAAALYGTTGTTTTADGISFSKDKSVVNDAFISGNETADLPLIKDLTIGISPSSGATCTDAGLLNALTMLGAFSDSFVSSIKTVSAPDAESTSFILDDGVEVAFGAAVDVEQKEKVVSALLKQYPNAISYINVRIVSRPSWRGITVSG